MLIVFIAFFIIVQNQLLNEQEKKDQDVLTEMRELISKEFALAEKSNDGYSRKFWLPMTVNGQPYQLRFIPGPAGEPGEIGITYLNEEKPLFLRPMVTNYSISSGMNRVSKFGGRISVVNSTAVCGDGIIQNPNFDLIFEECEQDSECVFPPNTCNTTNCYCDKV